jgi:hypothetical protein
VLSNNDISILEQIIEKNGNCMLYSRCTACPFRALCLPEFLNPIPPSAQQRKNMAIDILAHHSIIGEDIEVQSYRWDQR